MNISSKLILNILHIIAWIIFVGVSINAGGFVSNTIYTLTVNSNLAGHFWGNLNLSNLYQSETAYFITVTTIMSITSTIKAIMFFLIVKLLYDKKLNLVQPFNAEVGRFIFLLFYLTLAIGFFCKYGSDYTKWLTEKGILVPSLEELQLGGADVWFFMSIILFIIAHIFKRGIEIQAENELTI